MRQARHDTITNIRCNQCRERSYLNENFRNASSSPAGFRSPRDASNTRPNNESRATPAERTIVVNKSGQTRNVLFPMVLVTTVRPISRVGNTLGALTSYHSFFRNGSVLQQTKVEVLHHRKHL